MNEQANTLGPTSIRDGLYKIAVALAHVWLWSLNGDWFEIRIRFEDIGMRTDIPRTKGKLVKITMEIVEDTQTVYQQRQGPEWVEPGRGES